VSTPKIPISLPDEDTPIDAYAGPEQPTVKRNNPISPPAMQDRTTMKMKKADIDALVKNASEKDTSGMRAAVTDEDIAEYQREADARKNG
jgi:hypothetical protein